MTVDRAKVTVLVPCCNEEENIEECLAGVRWADEIMVVDSGSADKTLEIARRFTDRILEHEYVNSAAQKNWAIPQASHKWVLVVDCDERVTPELRDEILEVLKQDGAGFDGFRIHRTNHFFGKRIKRCGWERDDVLRLFRRDKSRYLDREVHADVIVDGKTGRLKGKFLHYTYRSFDQYFKKFERYTTWASGDLYNRGSKAGVINLFFRPIWRFFRMYVVRLGFLDGIEGLILCTLAAFSVFTKYAKLRERIRKDGKAPDRR